jgi:hypothetical protein
MMKKRSWLFASLVSLASMVAAQNAPEEGIVESTDPAKIAEIERHAQELASRQNADMTDGSARSSESGDMKARPHEHKKHKTHKRKKEEAQQ